MKVEEFTRKIKRRIDLGAVSATHLNFKSQEDRKSANVDPEYESTPGIDKILSAIRNYAPAIFISGRAGTGKSKFIRYLASIPEGKNQMVVAPTGIAAMNIGGATIHSTFGLPFGPIDVQKIKAKKSIVKELKRVSRLIIDEISMVRSDMIDAIDIILQEVRADKRPFGGVQIVMIGDFLQLPPVVKSSDAEILSHLGYITPFAFSAKALQNLKLEVVTLTKVWRQSDPEFISVLGSIREGRRIIEAVNWLNLKCYRPAREGSIPMILTPTKSSADEHNMRGLSKLIREREQADAIKTLTHNSVDTFEFVAKKVGTFIDSKNPPVPSVHKIVVGLRVMALRNDPNGGYVNGSLGTVTSIEKAPEEKPGDEKPSTDNSDQMHVYVLFDGHKHARRVCAVEWEDIKYEWDGTEIQKKVVGKYTQMPLVYGYATTIHKSQGLSLEDVCVDLGRGAFAPGQLYVALSRAKSAEGLSITKPIRPQDVMVDEMLHAFLDWAQGNSNINVSKIN